LARVGSQLLTGRVGKDGEVIAVVQMVAGDDRGSTPGTGRTVCQRGSGKPRLT